MHNMDGGAQLLDLPNELLLEILNYSNYSARFTQQLTCRRLNRLLQDSSIFPERPRCLDLLLLEQILHIPPRYTCTHCLRVRPRSSFLLSGTKECPRGYWSVAKLLNIEANGPGKAAQKFLFNRKVAPVDQGRRRMMAASIEAGLSGMRRTTPPALPVSATSAQAVTPIHNPASAHPSLPPSAPRDRLPRASSSKTAFEKPPHSERICIDCGVKKHLWGSSFVLRYPLNDEAKEIGTAIICKRCNRFAPCAPDSRALLNKRCEACLEYRPPGTRWLH